METRRILYRCAFTILLGAGVPSWGFAQGQNGTTARDSSAVRDMPLTAEQRKAYVGDYSTELPGGETVTLRIFEDNGDLKLWASNPGESRRLLYQGDNVFIPEKTPGFTLTFVVLNNTAITFKVHKPEGDLTAVRIH